RRQKRPPLEVPAQLKYRDSTTPINYDAQPPTTVWNPAPSLRVQTRHCTTEQSRHPPALALGCVANPLLP
ncbi:MAG TPA: hypothetical protein VFA65_15165, partial [Bryobacteraceae bacterium]|nr:hypothetical protein [Bryobacteraceae bacterium]